MKIGIISDLHLGFRQYGSIDRENDFYNQFFSICKQLNKYKPDIVIIAGDLFDKPNPSPAAINAYREGIQSLNSKIICTIKGNHTMILRDNHYSIDDFFGKNKDKGYYYLDDETFSINGVVIDGITYRNNSSLDEFFKVQKNMALKQYSDCYRILIVHQSFKEFCGFYGEELSIEDIDYSNYNAIICGHIHSRYNTVLPNGCKFIQPGSIERMNTTEALDEQKNGKGFYLLDTDNNSVEFYQVDCPRKFFLGEIKFDKIEDLEKHLEDLNNDVSKLEIPPIISYKYQSFIENIEGVREKINSIDKDILLNKSHIDDKSQEDISIEITDNELPTVLEALKIFGEEKGLEEKEVALSIDLYNALSQNTDNASGIIDSYFEKNRKKFEEKNYEDEELQELVRYFM